MGKAGAAAKAVDLVGSGMSTSGKPLPKPDQAPTEPAPARPASKPKPAAKPAPARTAPAAPAAQDTPRRTIPVPASVGGAVNSGAGFLLGLMAWSWIALPFLKGGPSQVKAVLMAKFLNKAPDGSFLP